MRIKLTTVKVAAGPKDDLDEGQFTAYASTFTREPDAYGDVIAKGAFEESLEQWSAADSVLPLLFGHRMDDPDFNIGHIVKGEENDHGLLITAQLDLDSPKAAQVYRLLKGRRVNQMSFSYDVMDSGQIELEDGTKAVELRKLRIHEISVVPVGANQETEVLAVKMATEAISQKAGRRISAKNESSLRSAYDAIGSVLSTLEEDGKDPDKSGDNHQDAANGYVPGKAEDPPKGKTEDPKQVPSASVLADLLLLSL